MQGVSKFRFTFDYNQRDLKYLLNVIYSCYIKIINEVNSISAIENDIRDVFISDKYLNNYKIKNELGVIEFLFDKEIYTETGRADIRILNMVEQMSGIEKPYYFIECKVLDASKPSLAKSNLYSKYIDEGINRFIIEKYLTHHEANAMLGFFIKSANIKKQCEFFVDLKPFSIIDNYELSYISEHSTESNKKIKLYHLMLDFSSRIQKVNY